MGIRGLTTFIARDADRYMRPYELHDSSLVIDGNNLASQLYKWASKCNSTFGGDYDIYYKTVYDFFTFLQNCRIKSYVLFDGGYENRKLKTVYARLKSKINGAQSTCPMNQTVIQHFPLMLRDVFRDVLVDLKIQCMQCEFEADDEIANVARKLNCPVLSYDSDFYIYNVLYIPFSTVDLSAVNAKTGSKQVVKCKIYRVNLFLKAFGLKEEILPLVATFLGNDYIHKRMFKRFYSHLKLPKSRQKKTDQQRTIAALLNWLQYENFESAINKVLGRLKMSKRIIIAEKIKKVVSGYNAGPSKALHYFDIECSSTENNSCNTNTEQNLLNNPEEINIDEEESSSEEEEEKNSDSESDFEETTCDLTSPNTSEIPAWFIDSYSRGIFPSYFMDLITRRTYFAGPQVEDFSYCDAGRVSLPILEFIVILLNNANLKTFAYFARNEHNKLQRHVIHISDIYKEINKPSLEKLHSNYPRYDLFNEFLTKTINGNALSDIKLIPEDYHIYIIAIIFWGTKVSEPKITSAHLHSLILCLLYLNHVDSETGTCRSPIKFRNKFGAKVKSYNEKKDSSSQLQTGSSEIYQNEIPHEECILVADKLISNFSIEEKLKSNNKLFCRTTVHIYAMLQCVIQHLNHLNSLVGFPKKQCSVAKFFNGTLLYNFYQNFKKRNDVDAYIELLLKDSSSFLNNHVLLMNLLKKFLPDAFINNPIKKRRKRNKKSKVNCEETVNEKLSDSEGDYIHDVNNKFTILNFINEN